VSLQVHPRLRTTVVETDNGLDFNELSYTTDCGMYVALNEERISGYDDGKGARPIMRRTIRYTMILAAMLAAVLPAVSARAQGSRIDAETARLAIERTDMVITQAKEVVEESRSVKARTVLEHAVQLQDKAKNSAGMTYYGMAVQFTNEARTEAQHAIALARQDAQIEERFRRMAEETAERLIRIRAQMAESGVRDEHLQHLMEEARDLLDKARLNHQQLRGELALQLTENASRLALRAEERFRRMRSLKETCERRLALAEQLMDRARERIEGSGDEQEASRLRIAEQNLVRARTMLSEGNYEACRATIENTERMLRMLSRNLSAGGNGESERMVAEARRLMERAEEMLGAGSGAPDEAYALLERAREMLRRAGEALEGGNDQEAKRLAEEARRMLRRAIEQGNDEITPEQARARIRDAEELGEMVRLALQDCRAEGATDLYERAVRHIEQARLRLDEKDPEGAAAQARIARNLMNRIREICAE